MRSLDEAVRSGAPLIDVIVRFKDGIDYAAATAIANTLGPDFTLNKSDWHGDPKLRIGQVTAEGALRHFGVKIRRVPLEEWNQHSQQFDGVNSDTFRWEQLEISQWPARLMPYVESISMTQPGANDDCQSYVPLFDR